MERRYYRQYENFEKVVPNTNDFPKLNIPDPEVVNKDTEVAGKTLLGNFKTDDLVLIGILILLLNEKEKDVTTILIIAFLFLSEYIF